MAHERSFDTSVRSERTMSSGIRAASNYHHWVFSSFARFIEAGSALEIGSGHGIYSRLIAAVVARVIVSDIDPAAIERIRSDLADLTNVSYLVMDGIDARVLKQTVNNVVLVNVLEHIEDDLGFLRSCRASLEPGGSVIVYAPAFELLYSRMDREAGHHRRYGRARLRALLTEAGFDIVHLRFVNAVGFFGWLANKYSRSAIDSPTTNGQIALFDRMVPLFKYVDRALPFVGQSLLAVGRRRN
jgi:SAM-dependent methyltransferase